jgi:phosphate/sulfate permease
MKQLKLDILYLFSPLFGFSMAIALMFLLKSFIKNKAIFKEPEEGARPPLWIRAILFCTCTLVSFFHGYNDGQKGIGLMLIVLFAFLPAQHALSPDFDKNKFQQEVNTIYAILDKESHNNYLMERTLCLEADKLKKFSKFVHDS